MKRISVILVSLIVLAILCLPDGILAKTKATVAVLDFESIGAEEHLGKAVAEIIQTELVWTEDYRVVERVQINRALSE